ERRWLRDACAEADQLARIEAALDGADLQVRGSQGQPVPNGLLGEATRARTTIATLLARLGLDDPAHAAGRGRGSRTTATSPRDRPHRLASESPGRHGALGPPVLAPNLGNPMQWIGDTETAEPGRSGRDDRAGVPAHVALHSKGLNMRPIVFCPGLGVLIARL